MLNINFILSKKLHSEWHLNCGKPYNLGCELAYE